MFRKLKDLFSKINQTNENIHQSKRELDELKILMGNLISLQNQRLDFNSLEGVEFKVFSQWGDDGIIQYLINKINIPNKTFIEFGVENYVESNTRFLLMNNNWSGMVIDGSESNIKSIKASYIYWKYDLNAINKFVTAENIDFVLAMSDFESNIGLLSIDIDGNDYWVWSAISEYKPIIVIIEYNSVFGPDKHWTVPYDPNFIRNNIHYSNLFYGTSLNSIVTLSNEKGYSFIGCNSAGNNAYFVRNDSLGDLEIRSVKEGFVESRFRESRNKSGELNYLRGSKRLDELLGLQIYNTKQKILEFISN